MHSLKPRLRPLSFLLLTCLLGGLLTGLMHAQSPAEPVLIWADEFATDGLPDPEKWLYDVGGDGWGNDEAQFYTKERPENARVEDGILIIEARDDGWPENTRNPTHDFTSARLVSKGRGDWLYGRIEVRAKLPEGRGTWPAIWMLPTGNEYGGWPRSGEIDIMEHVGFDMGTIHGSLHSLNKNWSTGNYPTGTTTLPAPHENFHTYAVDWTPEGITFLIDGQAFYTAPNPNTSWEDWPFSEPFHLILNIAVGGFWGGQQGIDPDIWPQRLEIDYVRVYDLGDTVALDTDGDQIPNATDPDDDGDGLEDVAEHELGTNLLKPDSDGDGFSDGDEVVAGTNPRLSSSYPGADPSVILANPAFEAGTDPWIVHTNFLNAEGTWIGQEGSWGGAYPVSQYVTGANGGDLLFTQYSEGNAPGAEHLLYQEFSSIVTGIGVDDVIRFRGAAMLEASDPGIKGLAFIRVLDGGFQMLPDSAILPLTATMTPFALETTITGDYNVIQVGLLITGPQSNAATITFRDLIATVNEDVTPMWADWPITDGWVDTTPWIGLLNVTPAPWTWSDLLKGFLYLPEDHVQPGGAWAYVLKP